MIVHGLRQRTRTVAGTNPVYGVRSTMKPAVVVTFLIVIGVCLGVALDKPVSLCTPGSVEALFTNC